MGSMMGGGGGGGGGLMGTVGGMLGESEEGKEATLAKWANEWKKQQAMKEKTQVAGQGGLAQLLQQPDQGIGTPIYSFQQGGTVPGPPGQPQMAMLHGGEQVTNPMLGQQPGLQQMPGMGQPRGPWGAMGARRPGMGRRGRFPGRGGPAMRQPMPRQRPPMPGPMQRPGGSMQRPGMGGPGSFLNRQTPGGTRPGFGAGSPMPPGKPRPFGTMRRGLGQGMQPRPNAWQKPTLQGRRNTPMFMGR